MQTAPPADTTDPRESVSVSEEIAAPSDVVFDLLTDPAELGQWLRAPDGSPTRDWTLEPAPGGRWRATTGPEDAARDLHGEVIEIDRPNALELTWHDDALGGAETRVRFTLRPLSVDGEEWTRLTVTHTMHAARKARRIVTAGHWDTSLRALASLVSRLLLVAAR